MSGGSEVSKVTLYVKYRSGIELPGQLKILHTQKFGFNETPLWQKVQFICKNISTIDILTYEICQKRENIMSMCVRWARACDGLLFKVWHCDEQYLIISVCKLQYYQHYIIDIINTSTRGERIVFSGPNANMNTIRVHKFGRIQIQILFGLRIMA